MRSRGWAVVGAVVLAAIPVGAPSANAAIPLYPQATIVEVDRIVTNPFAGSTATKVVGDAEGLTRDPVRNTLWLSDDKNGKLHEIDLVTRRKVGEITAAQFAAATNLIDGSPAGMSRIGDNEGIAYDDVSDSMYVFSGSCCSVNPHTPTLFRLKRPAPGAAFVPETYQRLEDLTPNDFGAADVRNGVLYTSARDARGWSQVYPLDYASRTLGASVGELRAVSGWVSGLAFSDDGTDMWVTSTNNNMYRYRVPGYTLVPNYEWSSVYAFGKTRDARAIEIIDDKLYVADGYDGHSNTSPSAFAIHIWEVVEIATAPTASFITTPTPATGEAPLSVRFTDTSTGLPTDWDWEWGDGTANSGGREPSHTFTTPGTYTVRMTATNVLGSSVATLDVVITGSPVAPVASFTVNRSTGAAPLAVSFTDTSAGVPTAWSWDFGDGGPPASTRNASRTFTAPGTYTVKLTVTNANGSSETSRQIVVTAAGAAPTAAFTTSVTSGTAPLSVTFTDTSAGLPTSWAWNFGDGGTATTANASRTFTVPGTYDVVLTATNAAGSSQATQRITVTAAGTAPTAAFTTSTASGVAPLTVQFTDSSTGVPSPTVSWDFGDGTAPVTTRTPSHEFTTPGSFVVRLTATNAVGSASTTATITVEAPPVAPVASFTASAGGGVAPLSVQFTNTSTGSPTPTYSWDFGDGGPGSTAVSPTRVFSAPGAYDVVLRATNSSGTVLAAKRITVAAPPAPPPPPVMSSFVGLSPIRLLDTRPAATIDGDFAGGGPVGPGEERRVRVTGRGDVPGLGQVGAVALNVTAVGPTSESYVTVWPTGQRRPTASNLNLSPGRTTPNMVVVPVGEGGLISLYNEAGATDLVVDLLGWFPAGAGFSGVNPARVLDTRPAATVDGRESGAGPFGAGVTRTVPIAGRAGVPVGAGSVAVNITAVGATSSTYLTVFPLGADRPTASNLNVVPGRVAANMAILPLGTDGRISIYNDAGAVDVLVDVLGWFPSSSGFTALPGARLSDSRSAPTVDGRFSAMGPLGLAGVRSIPVTGRGGVPRAGVGAVVLNVTAVAPSDASYLTVWPTGPTDRPNASNLNVSPGDVIANLVIVPVGPGGMVSLYNDAGSTDLIVDVLGWFPTSA